MSEVEAKWRAENKEKAAKLDLFLSGKTPEIDYSAIQPGSGVATRAASAAVLGTFASQIENMVVSSADLSNSDKTDGFLKKTKAFRRGDFSGQFFQAGVSEFTMACIMNGMALHGGIIPVCGTFFVFSDYMKPVVRLSALMRLHVIFVWSHDSFRVGEDGPTQEVQIRLMEQLHNHRSERSMVVLRPADAAETVQAWKVAVEESRPVALLLSRQNLSDLPEGTERMVSRGAYIVSDCHGTPDIVLIGNGSDVSTLVETASLLGRDGIAARVVSVPSEGLFRDQGQEYADAILPRGVKRFGLTSGLPVNLLGLVGENGMIHGLDHFGYSAPYKVLDEKFGYNAQTIYKEVKEFLGR